MKPFLRNMWMLATVNLQFPLDGGGARESYNADEQAGAVQVFAVSSVSGPSEAERRQAGHVTRPISSSLPLTSPRRTIYNVGRHFNPPTNEGIPCKEKPALCGRAG